MSQLTANAAEIRVPTTSYLGVSYSALGRPKRPVRQPDFEVTSRECGTLPCFLYQVVVLRRQASLPYVGFLR